MAKLWRLELHAAERPVALGSYIAAKTSSSKGNKMQIEDFYMYQPVETKNIARNAAANATVALINSKQFPGWALFCYKDLVANAGGPAPELLAFICNDAILLAPEKVENGYRGLLIAMESSSEKVRQMVSPCGQTLVTRVPRIPTKIIAEDDITLVYV